MYSKQSVSQATAILGAFAILSGLLGYLRESLVAYIFGPSAQLDAYLAAFLIPNLFINILNATVPFIFINLLNRIRIEEGETAGWAFAQNMLKYLAGILAVLTLACALLAGPLLRLVVPGFTPTTLEMAKLYFYLLAPTVVFSGLFVYATAILQAYKHFIWPAVLSLCLNLCTIVAMLLWGRRIGITSLALGVLAGNLVPCVAALWVLRGRHMPAAGAYPERAIRREEWLHFILPVLLLFALDQLNLLVVRTLASYLQEGSISMLYFANIILQLIQMIIILPVCRAIYPEATSIAAGGDMGKLAERFLATARYFLLVTLPIVFGIWVLREEIIQVLFMRGAFQQQHVHVTATLFLFYALALLPLGLENIMLVTFLTLRRVWPLIAINTVGIAINLAASLVLIRPLQVAGLAVANLLFHTVTCGLMLGVFQRIVKQLPRSLWLKPLLNLLGMTLLMGSATWMIREFWLRGLIPQVSTLVFVGAEVTVSALIYMGAGFCFKNGELLFATQRIKRFLARS